MFLIPQSDTGEHDHGPGHNHEASDEVGGCRGGHSKKAPLAAIVVVATSMKARIIRDIDPATMVPWA